MAFRLCVFVGITCRVSAGIAVHCCRAAANTISSGWLSTLWSLLGVPKILGALLYKGPNRDHNFHNHAAFCKMPSSECQRRG